MSKGSMIVVALLLTVACCGYFGISAQEAEKDQPKTEEPKPEAEPKTVPKAAVKLQPRFKFSVIGEIQDRPYVKLNERRPVYLLSDSVTKAEYIVVLGTGIIHQVVLPEAKLPKDEANK